MPENSITVHEWHSVYLGRIIELFNPWREWSEMLQSAVVHAKEVKQEGRGPGSLEPEETAGLDYRILTAPMVREHCRWLWNLYRSKIMEDFVSGILGRDVQTHPASESCINVNYLLGPGGRYELHTDPQRWTMVLFGSDHYDEGQLQLWESGVVDQGRLIQIIPKAGHAIIFDSAAIPHRVLPLTKYGWRISVPMVFHTEPPIDDSETNAYLYAGNVDERDR